MTLQEPFKWQPKVEQHHLVRSLPNPPAPEPEGRRLTPTHIPASGREGKGRERCTPPATTPLPPPAQAHLALGESVSRYKEENSFGRALVSAEADPSGSGLCRRDAGELAGPKPPWQEGRVLQKTFLCKEALELQCTRAAWMQHRLFRPKAASSSFSPVFAVCFFQAERNVCVGSWEVSSSPASHGTSLSGRVTPGVHKTTLPSRWCQFWCKGDIWGKRQSRTIR